MQTECQILTQSQTFSTELKQLKNDVTASDRAVAVKELGFSRATISAYLKGVVKDNDTAASLLSFFKGRIQARSIKAQTPK